MVEIRTSCLIAALLAWLMPADVFAMLHPQQGRFMQRDPLRYVDGMGLYECVASRPVILLDPKGTSWCSTRRCLPSTTGPNRFNLRPGRLALAYRDVTPSQQEAPADWAKASLKIDSYLDWGNFAMTAGSGFYRAYNRGSLQGSCLKAANKAEELLYENCWKKHAQGEDPELIEGVLNNYFSNRQRLDGYSVWVGIEYEECVSCTRNLLLSGLLERMLSCCEPYHMERSKKLYWVQCTEGSGSRYFGASGLYGGPSADNPTPQDITACTNRALQEASK